jgi:hypothetical protein
MDDNLKLLENIKRQARNKYQNIGNQQNISNRYLVDIKRVFHSISQL